MMCAVTGDLSSRTLMMVAASQTSVYFVKYQQANTQVNKDNLFECISSIGLNSLRNSS